MASVTIDHVWKYYGTTEAVRDLNLDCADGEFLCVLGPSGCGKSSTLRMLAGLEHISAGDIRFGPKRVNDLPPKDRDIAMVFENYALYPHKTVRDNIANALRLRGMGRADIERRVKKAADLLQIGHLLERKPQELSGGQKQRVAIGRAIVREPQLFLFDEPIAHLDAKLRAHMRGELKIMQRELGTTMIYVTHDQLEALSMADRIAVMHEGVLQQFGTPQEIYDHPVNAWVAGFVGEPPMNFVGRIEEPRDGAPHRAPGLRRPGNGRPAGDPARAGRRHRRHDGHPAGPDRDHARPAAGHHPRRRHGYRALGRRHAGRHQHRRPQVPRQNAPRLRRSAWRFLPRHLRYRPLARLRR
jgi:ABC-type sugar transport system ATPase subunit